MFLHEYYYHCGLQVPAAAAEAAAADNTEASSRTLEGHHSDIRQVLSEYGPKICPCVQCYITHFLCFSTYLPSKMYCAICKYNVHRRPDSAAAGLTSSSSPAVFAESSPNLSGVSPIEQNVLKKVGWFISYHEIGGKF